MTPMIKFSIKRKFCKLSQDTKNWKHLYQDENDPEQESFFYKALRFCLGHEGREIDEIILELKL